MTMPDFETWAYNIVNSKEKVLTIAKALEQAFEQGYHYGLDYGWAIEQNKDLADADKG